MQMPDARFGREGEFSVNYRDNDQYRFYSPSVVLFPWLEGTIRYTDVRTRKYSSDEDFSGDQSYKDKSFDFKVRLWEEDYSLRRWRSASAILRAPACSTVNIWLPINGRTGRFYL